LVHRSASSADRRAVEVYLSDQGMALATQLGADLAGAIAPITDELDVVERDELRRLLAKVTSAAVPVA
jgi:DNA-binding MarR family transcriptional regulator